MDDARRLRLGSSADTNAAPTTPTPTAAGGNAPDGAKVTERHSNMGGAHPPAARLTPCSPPALPGATLTLTLTLPLPLPLTSCSPSALSADPTPTPNPSPGLALCQLTQTLTLTLTLNPNPGLTLCQLDAEGLAALEGSRAVLAAASAAGAPFVACATFVCELPRYTKG